MKTVALIVAAGTGSRAGEGIPKQYRPLKGKPLLLHSIQAFSEHPAVAQVLVVIGKEHEKLYSSFCGSTAESSNKGLDAAVKSEHDGKMLPPVTGGVNRQKSVRRGLEALKAHSPDYVLIHDAARPLVDAPLINRVVEGLKKHRAVIPVLPVTDTLKTLEEGRVITIDRDAFYRTQTPQGFDFKRIHALHEKYADQAATDDAMLAEWEGIEVGLVPGDERNIKITTALDFTIAGAL